jgi:N-acetylneuraminic acid mutarotase
MRQSRRFIKESREAKEAKEPEQKGRRAMKATLTVAVVVVVLLLPGGERTAGSAPTAGLMPAAGVDARMGTAPYPKSSITRQGTWSNGTPMSLYRSEHAATMLNGRIYVAGGLAGPDNNFTGVTLSFASYDPATDTWREEDPVPEELHHMGIAALGGRIYITGGYTDSDFTVDNNKVYVYDPGAPPGSRWTRAADMPDNRAAHASAAIGGLLYVVGGVGPNSAQLWVYNPATNSWDTTRAPLPTQREHLTAVGLNGKLYAIGGRWFGFGNVGTLEEYDPAINTWTTRPSMPTPRSGLTAAVVHGRIHVTGGEDLGSSHTFNEHEVYNPAVNSWSTFVNMPTARHGVPSASIDNRWYVIGGGLHAGNETYSSLTNIVEVFTLQVNN